MSPSRILLLISSALLLSACSALGQQKMGVALTAINYTEDDYDAVGIAMPDDIKTFEAMDRVSAYGGSGTMCCVALPEKWQPGMKMVVLTQAGTKAKTYKEWAYEKIPVIPHDVDVPRYATPARVWIQIMSPDKVLVTVSNYSPENPNWPGEIKGGPIPSMEYRRKVWLRDYKIMTNDLRALEQGVKENPEKQKLYSRNIEYLKEKIKLMELKKP
jgi:hypothetical protein